MENLPDPNKKLKDIKIPHSYPLQGAVGKDFGSLLGSIELCFRPKADCFALGMWQCNPGHTVFLPWTCKPIFLKVSEACAQQPP